jgi:hypothetical protein
LFYFILPWQKEAKLSASQIAFRRQNASFLFCQGKIKCAICLGFASAVRSAGGYAKAKQPSLPGLCPGCA